MSMSHRLQSNGISHDVQYLARDSAMPTAPAGLPSRFNMNKGFKCRPIVRKVGPDILQMRRIFLVCFQNYKAFLDTSFEQVVQHI